MLLWGSLVLLAVSLCVLVLVLRDVKKDMDELTQERDELLEENSRLRAEHDNFVHRIAMPIPPPITTPRTKIENV